MFCKTYNALLDRYSIAASSYHEATSKLMSLAGQSKTARFAEAKHNCETCLNDCKSTSAAMRVHKAAHGC